MLFLSSCYSFHIEPVKPEEFVNKYSNRYPVPIKLEVVSWNIPRGAVVGHQRRGFTCTNPGDIYWSSARETVKDIEFEDLFYEELSLKGFDVTGAPGQLYRREDDNVRAYYKIGAQIRGYREDVCEEVGFWSRKNYGKYGELSLNVHWQVYSTYEKEIIFEIDTQGYARLDNSNPYGNAILVNEAFASASLGLANNADFQKLIFIKDSADTQKKLGKWPFKEIRFHETAEFQKPIEEHSEDIVEAAVLIRSASGHGSGFFISDDGYILTNQHVIGDANEIYVEDIYGKQMKAKIIRYHNFRDVALIQIVGAKNLKIKTLPIRKKLAVVGEDVYAIGSPQDKVYKNSLTKGTVSSWRDYLYDNSYIQSDVEIHPGNSGGALLDKNGNVIGIAVKGRVSSEGNGTGLNFFIPIHEALNKLNINFY